MNVSWQGAVLVHPAGAAGAGRLASGLGARSRCSGGGGGRGRLGRSRRSGVEDNSLRVDCSDLAPAGRPAAALQALPGGESTQARAQQGARVGREALLLIL